MFSGIKVKIGEEEITIPPISLGLLRGGVTQKLKEHDKLVADGSSWEAMELRGEIILLAIQRNYPEFTETKLFDYLDAQNSTPIWLSILGASGFTPGEEQAAAVKDNGTLSPSTEA